MRDVTWRSTDKSRSREAPSPSILAVVETGLASATLLGLVVYGVPVTRVFAVLILTPVILTQTPQSRAFAQRALKRIATVTRRTWIQEFISYSIGVSLLIVWLTWKWPNMNTATQVVVAFLVTGGIRNTCVLEGAISRIVGWIYGIFDKPAESIRAIPANFRYYTMTTDIFSPPELVPGLSEVSSENATVPTHNRTRAGSLKFDVQFDECLDTIRQSWAGASDKWRRPWEKAVCLALIVLEALILVGVGSAYATTMVWRYSLKSTSVVWGALLWVDAFGRADAPIRRLHMLARDRTSTLLLVWSMATIVALLGRIAIYNLLPEAISHSLLDRFTALDVFLIAQSFSSAIFICLYFWSRRQLIGIPDTEMRLGAVNVAPPFHPGGRIDVILRAANLVRLPVFLLGLAVLIRALWVADIELPPMRAVFSLVPAS